MRLILILTVLSLVMIAGCAAQRGEPISKPLTIASPELARGEQAYKFYCDKCHPGGEQGLGPALSNKPLPGFLIKTQVRAGVGAMPAFSKKLLTDEQLDTVVIYLETLRKQ